MKTTAKHSNKIGHDTLTLTLSGMTRGEVMALIHALDRYPTPVGTDVRNSLRNAVCEGRFLPAFIGMNE